MFYEYYIGQARLCSSLNDQVQPRNVDGVIAENSYALIAEMGRDDSGHMLYNAWGDRKRSFSPRFVALGLEMSFREQRRFDPPAICFTFPPAIERRDAI